MSRYSSPAAFKNALEHRLRDLARERDQDLNRFRQLLVFDRFMVRVAKEFGDEVILKGGFALELQVQRARTTRDIDLRFEGDVARVLERLRAASTRYTDDYFSFEIGPEVKSLGRDDLAPETTRLRSQAVLAGKIYGAPFGVDIAFGDILTQPPTEFSGSDVLAFAGVEPHGYLIYPREAHIAEKLHAYTLPRPRENSRLKDLPDLALLATTGEFDARTLRIATESTFSARTTHPLPRSLPLPPERWREPYQRMAAHEGLIWEHLEDLFRAAAGFLDPVLAGRDGTWSPSRWAWSSP